MGQWRIQVLGLEKCELVADLDWASEVTNALKAGLSDTLKNLQAIRQSISGLPDSGVPGEVKESAAEPLSKSGGFWNRTTSLKS